MLNRPLPIAFVVAVVLRLAAQVVLGAYAHPQTWEYEDIANSLLAGRGYTYTVGQTTYVAAVSSPLYVLLTAGVYALTQHSQAVMLVLGALFGGATASLAAWLAKRTGGCQAAWLAGLLVAIDPSLLVYSSELHPLALDALAFLTVICATVVLPAHPSARHIVRVGLALGVAALTRTTVLSLTPILLVWAHRYRRLPFLSWASLVLVVVALLVYSPWPIRNSLLLGQLVPGSSEASEWLWRGTNPNATGSSYTPDQRTMLEVAPAAFQTRIADSSETQRMSIYRDTAEQYVAQHPLDALRLYAVKLKSFWWGSETTGALYPPLWTPLYEAWYAAMLVLSAFGVWSASRQRESRGIVMLILASLALVSLSQAIFYVEGRHRIAVEPLLLVLAGIGMSHLALRIGQPRLAALRTKDNPT